ncbi:MAG TPA: DUF192 domain-containing protein [Elusimicrobiales bacterium]|nr:DUF192 domain-containing protein [Elusimicrobiales bacterium]
MGLLFAWNTVVSAQEPARVAIVPQSAVVSFKNGVKVQADVVSTPEKMARGLMYAQGLPAGKGMFFLYQEEGPRRFWMKNMLFDLDIIFLRHDGRMNRIFKNVRRSAPGTPDSDVSVVEGNGSYVLEVAAGFADQNGLKEGARAEISFSTAPVSAAYVSQAAPNPASKPVQMRKQPLRKNK